MTAKNVFMCNVLLNISWAQKTESYLFDFFKVFLAWILIFEPFNRYMYSQTWLNDDLQIMTTMAYKDHHFKGPF